MLEELVRKAGELGYKADAKLLTATDYGSPQVRRRIFIIGIRNDVGVPSFPIPTHSPVPNLLEASYTTVGEAFAGLPPATPSNGIKTIGRTDAPITIPF
ncbi:DNA cytosine methyltransferase [Microcoleus sp. herbarium7]|uniref:DNA cytosine methyltransferase n=1 Tax=Microcoleus sp. herbarium7 TaxID=3055435 RepID=UPI002FD0E12F